MEIRSRRSLHREKPPVCRNPQLKAEVQEVEAVKKCVEQTVQPKQTRAKTQSRKNDMEL